MDSIAAFWKEVERKFVELEQRLPKVDETKHAKDFNQLSKCRRISRLNCQQDSEKETVQRPDEHGVRDTITTVKSQTFKLNAAPSITEDPTIILVGKGLQEYEGKTPEMSSVTRLVSSRRGDILEGELGPYIPSSPVQESSLQAKAIEPELESISEREMEEAIWALGEVRFGNAESADGLMHPFPVLGVVAEVLS